MSPQPDARMLAPQVMDQDPPLLQHVSLAPQLLSPQRGPSPHPEMAIHVRDRNSSFDQGQLLSPQRGPSPHPEMAFSRNGSFDQGPALPPAVWVQHMEQPGQPQHPMCYGQTYPQFPNRGLQPDLRRSHSKESAGFPINNQIALQARAMQPDARRCPSDGDVTALLSTAQRGSPEIEVAIAEDDPHVLQRRNSEPGPMSEAIQLC